MVRTSFLLISLLPMMVFANNNPAQQCTDIQDNAMRLSCYDTALGFIASVPPKPVLEPSKDTIGVVVEPVAQVVESTMEVSSQVKKVVAPVEVNEQALDAAQAAYDDYVAKVELLTLASVKQKNYQYTYFTTSSGRRFKSVHMKSSRLRNGDEVYIEDGLLGAIYLVRSDGSRSKVKELK